MTQMISQVCAHAGVAESGDAFGAAEQGKGGRSLIAPVCRQCHGAVRRLQQRILPGACRACRRLRPRLRLRLRLQLRLLAVQQALRQQAQLLEPRLPTGCRHCCCRLLRRQRRLLRLQRLPVIVMALRGLRRQVRLEVLCAPGGGKRWCLRNGLLLLLLLRWQRHRAFAVEAEPRPLGPLLLLVRLPDRVQRRGVSPCKPGGGRIATLAVANGSWCGFSLIAATRYHDRQMSSRGH